MCRLARRLFTLCSGAALVLLLSLGSCGSRVVAPPSPAESTTGRPPQQAAAEPRRESPSATVYSDDGLKELADKQGIGGLSAEQLTDAGVAHLRGFINLAWLELRNSPDVGDAGLAAMPVLPELRVLNLYGTAVTDAGLHHLARHPKLVRLNLTLTAVTGRTIPATLPRLRELLLGSARLAPGALERIVTGPSAPTPDVPETSEPRRAGSCS